MARFILSTILPCAFALVQAQLLKLAAKHQGDTFFNGWVANGSEIDTTNYGFVHYLDDAAAHQASLLSVNAAGNAIVKVDNLTSDPNPGPDSKFGRNTVLLMSKETIDIGTLVVMDAVHIPFGCSVWPAFWTLDSVTHTDQGGEIDIIEYVNLMQTNQFSLHTKEGCKLVGNDSMPFSGSQTSDDCNFNVSGNRGCGALSSPTAKTVGQAFAQNGGGVYAMYWSTNGISMWFFQRSDIPADITSETPNPKSWGTPIASFPANGCDPLSFFNPQTMIINIDVCGSWADGQGVFADTGCTGKCGDVVGKASNYDNAFWEIKYVKTFTDGTSRSEVSTTSSKSGAANGTTSAGASGETAKSGSSEVSTTTSKSGAANGTTSAGALGETAKSGSGSITGNLWTAGLFTLLGYGLVL